MNLGIYELKYCERCGALGLRRRQSAETYCEACGQMLLNYFTPRLARRPQLRNPKLQNQITRKVQEASSPALGGTHESVQGCSSQGEDVAT